MYFDDHGGSAQSPFFEDEAASAAFEKNLAINQAVKKLPHERRKRVQLSGDDLLRKEGVIEAAESDPHPRRVAPGSAPRLGSRVHSNVPRSV